MKCEKIVEVKCSKGHIQKRRCHEKKLLKCKQCDIDEKRAEKEMERDIEVQDSRLRAQVKHDMDMRDLDEKLRKIREETEDKKIAQERAQALEQKKRDLEAAQRLASEATKPRPNIAAPKVTPPQQSPPSRPPSSTSTPSGNNANENKPQLSSPGSPQSTRTPKPPASKPSQHQPPPSTAVPPSPPKKSTSELEWERQKRVEGASNNAIDDLMALTGLEEVKEKFLDIKAKIETVARQGIDMKKERMGMVMLGNPGTGT